jgi:hypothetical protein
MKTRKKLSLVITLIALVAFSLNTRAAFNYSSTIGSSINFDGLGNFTLSPAVNNLKITSGSAAGLMGEMSGTFTIGAITPVGLDSMAPITGTGTLVIHDGANDLTATLVWLDIYQSGTGGFLNNEGSVNLTAISYSGSNPDLLALKNGGSGFNVFSFQFIPAVTLAEMKSTAQMTSFSGTIGALIPQCTCTLTFNSPSRLTICASDVIPDVTASGDCGNGPTPATVSMIGAVTNGVCPQIITTTNIATDGCGTVHTFVQTVTVNCSPDCTITTSVKTTTAGTTGLTASVADAGPGASYSWNVLNGTITTADPNTPTITWTAGNDINSPISIVVTVTSASGCSSTCSQSVQVTPKPPLISLGGGDTATIGFWHNKNGQGLILGAPNSPALANWLASNFPCMYGNLAGKPNTAVASLFLTDFGVKGQKTYAQILGGALACYFTSSNLGGGSASAKFGFNVTPGGTGAKVFNVGSLGTTIGLQNNTSYTVLQILQAANASINCSNGTFSPAVFNALNTIFDGINTTGDIS